MAGGNTSLNTLAAIRQSVYSEYIQKTLDGSFLPDGFMRDVSDFTDGDTIYIPTVGDLAAIKADPGAVEEQMTDAQTLDTGRIQLSITEYVSAAWYETAKLMEDQYLDIVGMAGPDRALYALKSQYETDAMVAHNAVQTAASVNAVNGAAHRFIAAGSSRVMTVNDIAYAAYALNTANIPDEGRIAVVDESVALTIDRLAGTQAFNYNPMFEGMVTTGFRKSNRFLRNIYGFDIYVGKRNPVLTASEAINASAYGLANTTATANDKTNFFFSVASDDVKPVMMAWRRRPKLESWIDEKFLDTRYSHKLTSRYGFATARPQGLVTILTGATG